MNKWKKIKLGDFSTVQGGYAFKSTEFIKNEIPIIRIGNLNGDTVDLDYNICYPQDFWDKNDAYRIKIGDILIAMSGATVGKIGRYIYNEPALLNQRVGLIRINENKGISNYIYQYVKSSLFLNQIQQLSFGCAQPNISAKNIENISIPLPPLQTQKQIAKTLDTAAELLAMRKQQLAELDNLNKSTFYDMFGDPVTNKKGWEIRRIMDIAKVETGSTPGRNNINYYDEGVVPWIKTGEISNGYILRAEEKISKTALKETNCKVFPHDTILVAMYGQGKTRGQAGMLKIEAATNQACAAILPSDLYISEFLFRQLEIKYEDLRELGRGGNQQNLNLSIVKDFKIIVPSLTFQSQFAEIVTKIEEQKALVKKAIDETQYLFDSLMSEYFE